MIFPSAGPNDGHVARSERPVTTVSTVSKTPCWSSAFHIAAAAPPPSYEDEVRVLLLEPLRVRREVLRRRRHEHAVHLLPGEIAEDVANDGDIPLPERNVLGEDDDVLANRAPSGTQSRP